MIERPKCMKANEVARWLGVAKITWVRSHIAGKTPRGLRLGRLVLWDCEELERWLKAGMPARVIWEAENKPQYNSTAYAYGGNKSSGACEY